MHYLALLDAVASRTLPCLAVLVLLRRSVKAPIGLRLERRAAKVVATPC